MISSALRDTSDKPVRRSSHGNRRRHQGITPTPAPAPASKPAPMPVGFAPIKTPVDDVNYRIRPEVLRQLRRTPTRRPSPPKPIAPDVGRVPAPVRPPSTARTDLQPNVTPTALQATKPVPMAAPTRPQKSPRRLMAATSLLIAAGAVAYYAAPLVGSVVASTSRSTPGQSSTLLPIQGAHHPVMTSNQLTGSADAPALTTVAVPVIPPGAATSVIHDVPPANEPLATSVPAAPADQAVDAALEHRAPPERALCPPANDALGLCSR